MAKEQQYGSARKGGMNMGKVLIYITILCVIAMVAIQYFKDGGVKDYTHVPKEVQFQYVPADFKASIDEQMALAVLSNPYRYEREFNELIYNFNLSLLSHVANRMGLPDTLKRRIPREYKKHHAYINRMYFDDFVALKDTTDNLYSVWYENENTSSVEILNEVASKYTCFLVTQVFSGLLETKEGRIYVKGNKVDTPCGIAMSEGLKPIMSRLSEQAAINDFSRSKGYMQERVETAVSELATMEVRDRKGINRQLQTKIWGMNVSTSDVEVSAISITKIGFKLDKYFDISLNSKRNLVTITLPEPEILSQEVHPRVDKLDIGWMREVEGLDLNKNIDLLRKQFRRDIYESDVIDKAKDRATELMETMFSPLVYSLNKKYKLKVLFKEMDSRKDFYDIPEPQQPKREIGNETSNNDARKVRID